MKGYTNWAIGAAVGRLVETIAADENRVVPISTLVTGLHGIKEHVFLSLPCIVGRHGIEKILEQPLQPDELEKFQKSAERIHSVQVSVFIAMLTTNSRACQTELKLG